MIMRCPLSAVAGLLAAACSPVPPASSAGGPLAAAEAGGSAFDARLTKVVPLAGPGAPVLLTARAPAGAAHSFEAGEDSQRHTIVAGGARVTFEYWIRQPTYSCQSAACGRTVVTIHGQPAPFIQLPGARSFVAFVPRRGDQGGRGVSIVGTCDTVEACSLARAIALSLRSV